MLVYGGRSSQTRSNAEVLAWSDLQKFDWTMGAGALPGRAKTRLASASKSLGRKPNTAGR